MSYDLYLTEAEEREAQVSIPLEQGNVLRHGGGGQVNIVSESQSLWNRAMSYDKAEEIEHKAVLIGLNPFGTGQCLTTVVGS